MKREFIFTDKWTEIVFENRNHSYGGYVLRKHLPRNILIGYSIALLFMGTVVFTTYQFSRISIDGVKRIIDALPPPIYIDKPPTTPPLIPPVPPGRTPPPQSILDNIIPVVKDSPAEAESKDKNLKENNTISSNDTSAVSDVDSSAVFPGTKESSAPAGPFPPSGVEKIPEFPGGESAMIKFIIRNTHVPVEYLNEEFIKTAYISFIVDSTGKIYGAKGLNMIDDYPKLIEEAMRTVNKMPVWIPGRQNGKNVSVIMTLPVKFAVKKDF